MKIRESWKTRFGFYFAAIGSAFGLGNLWRFPYIAKENGGGAFVLLYLFLVFFIGVPLLIGELMLGKTTKRSILSALRDVITEEKSKKLRLFWVGFGKLAVGASLLVLSYYAVISGWVLHFFMQFLVGGLQGEEFKVAHALETLKASGSLQVALASVHILLSIIIVTRGLQNGLEKWLVYVMSVFSVLLLILIYQSLSLPKSSEALRFLFYPDFSKLSVNSLGQALGHVLFTLSIGFGVMVTFGSYLRHNAYLPEVGLRVAFLDSFIALAAGLLVFPIILSSGSGVEGPDVLFQALPHFFGSVAAGTYFGMAFFLCLYLSALGASIGLLEVIVSNMGDRWGIGRTKSCWLVGGVVLLFAIIPALSSSALSELTFKGRSVLQTLDAFLIHWLLPIVALGLCLIVAFFLPNNIKEKEFHVSHHFEYGELFGNWQFMIKWGAPLLIITALILEFAGFFTA